MSRNKYTVQRYIDGFRAGDHEQILACLTDDVVWDMPGWFHKEGKAAFDAEIENEAFTGKPKIELSRLTEEDDVVIAEGSVLAQWKDGGFLEAVFCDVFEMRDGLIRRLVTYQVTLNDRAEG